MMLMETRTVPSVWPQGMQSGIPLLVEHHFVSKDQRPLLGRQVLIRDHSLIAFTGLPNI